MTYEDAVKILVKNEFRVSIWTRNDTVQRLEVYCSPILFNDKCREIEGLLGEGFKAFAMPNHDAIYVEAIRGISPDNGLKSV